MKNRESLAAKIFRKIEQIQKVEKFLKQDLEIKEIFQEWKEWLKKANGIGVDIETKETVGMMMSSAAIAVNEKNQKMLEKLVTSLSQKVIEMEDENRLRFKALEEKCASAIFQQGEQLKRKNEVELTEYLEIGERNKKLKTEENFKGKRYFDFSIAVSPEDKDVPTDEKIELIFLDKVGKYVMANKEFISHIMLIKNNAFEQSILEVILNGNSGCQDEFIFMDVLSKNLLEIAYRWLSGIEAMKKCSFWVKTEKHLRLYMLGKLIVAMESMEKSEIVEESFHRKVANVLSINFMLDENLLSLANIIFKVILELPKNIEIWKKNSHSSNEGLKYYSSCMLKDLGQISQKEQKEKKKFVLEYLMEFLYCSKPDFMALLESKVSEKGWLTRDVRNSTKTLRDLAITFNKSSGLYRILKDWLGDSWERAISSI